MKIREDVLYSETHEWVEFTEIGTVRVGISDYLQQSLGKISFVNLCGDGEVFETGDVIGDIEAFKGVAEIFAPVSGRVHRVNEELFDKPQLLNSAPYDVWIVEFEDFSPDINLMDSVAYATFVEYK